MLEWTTHIKIFTSLLALVNPLGAIPLFISLTHHQSVDERTQTARVAAFSVALILILAGFLGEPLLNFFGISVAAFQIGGGLLILLTAITMMGTQPSRGAQQNEAAEASEKDSVAVVPLATPLLAGPGAISTAIIFTHQTSSWLDIGILVASSVVVALLSWIALRSAIPISKALGKTGINVATHLMGLLLAAIAAEFLCTGLRELLPGLK